MPKDEGQIMRISVIVATAVLITVLGCASGEDASQATTSPETPMPKKVEAMPFPAGAPNALPAGEKAPGAKPDEQVVTFKADGKVVCPVMGAEIRSLEDADHYEHNGVRYYFCCGDCLPKFKADPAKYAEGKYIKAKPKAN